MERDVTSIHIRQLRDLAIVHSIPVRPTLSDHQLALAVLGILRNLREGLYVDTREVDDERSQRAGAAHSPQISGPASP